MKNLLQSGLLLILLFCGNIQNSVAQKSIESQISDSITVIANCYTAVGRVSVLNYSLDLKKNTVYVKANDRLAFMPFRTDNVKRIYSAIRSILPNKYSGFNILCQTENKNIEDLIPNFYKTKNVDNKTQFKVELSTSPLVFNASKPYDVSAGMQNRHIALWQSHGWHYDQKLARWEWQRARVMQVVEDLYTQSYVLPYLVPMLERAGANVLLPRERDTQINEVIVDNDTKDTDSKYKEHNDRKAWKTGEGFGFENQFKIYTQGVNPFTLGSYRIVPTVSTDDEPSRCEWIPNMPEDGNYAVYVSYKTLANSSTNARYTVFHSGGKTDFLVNQTMNGGTWVYLGTFNFDKGRNNQGKVQLSNYDNVEGCVVTADAVKFGGGMGNIARSPFVATKDSGKSKDSSKNQQNGALEYKIDPEVSRYPRFTEAARYWLQWAGMPDSIYSPNKGENDYIDDIQCHGLWVNSLVGGSIVAPNSKGLNVPLDLAFAFHTDAGTTKNDSIIGTLGISTTNNSDGKTIFQNGVSRWASRDLTDIIQSQIVNDIRTTLAPEWTRRGLWNKSYSESRVPEVPTMLLELLSHQNFADMRYGLDPRFRFTVSRAIYKGMLKYLSSANGTEYVVQPLPVCRFNSRFVSKNKIELHWVAVNDPLEPTARPDNYILYTRMDDGGFDNGVMVKSNRITLNIETGKIYGFKITAVNKGGESFPSEILSVCKAPNEHGVALIVNGFTRLSAPAGFTIDSTLAGFLNDVDGGVSYLSDISFVGKQYEFKRSKPWVDDDAPGFGASYANYETKVIAGNTFDYPYLHGKAIKTSGYSFVSCSLDAVLSSDIDMNNFKVVDLILGKQKKTFIGNAKKIPEFKTFPLALQQSIRTYTQQGGSILISGAYVGSDFVENESLKLADNAFLNDVLKCKFITSKASIGGEVKIVSSPVKSFRKCDFSYYNTPNSISYCVESSDGIEPSSNGSFTFCRYNENNISAGVIYSGNYKVCTLGFPFETIKSEKDRATLMNAVLQFFAGK